MQGSRLAEYRRKHGFKPVIGEGNHDAEIMFIGEAPGEEEAKCGRPFVGKSGKILDVLLREAGIARSEVYITSVVKDRPSGNRKPTKEEIQLYSPYTVKQIEIIKPKVIATLGSVAFEWVYENFGFNSAPLKISQSHGKCFRIRKGLKAHMISLYHPAVALYDPKMLSILEKDMAKVPGVVELV